MLDDYGCDNNSCEISGSMNNLDDDTITNKIKLLKKSILGKCYSITTP